MIDGQAIPALMLTASADRWAAVAVRGNLTIMLPVTTWYRTRYASDPSPTPPKRSVRNPPDV